jgi:hypothetical protein
LFLWLAVKGEDWSAVASALRTTDWRVLATLPLAGVYSLYVRCQRWQLLLERASRRPQPMGPIFSASAIGFMANMVLPFRIGEFARPYLVARHSGIPLSATVATVVLERILDLVALFFFGLWVVSATQVPTLVVRLTWIAGASVFVLFLAILTVHFRRAVLLPVVDRVWLALPGRIGQRIVRVEHEFLDALAVAAEGSVLLKALAWSIYLWLVIALNFSLGFLALGLDVPFLGAGVTVTTLVALAVSVPGAPGFVGQFEWGCKVALGEVYGVEGALAVAYSLVTHAAQWATQVAVGLVCLVRQGLSLSELERLQTRRAAAEKLT